MLGASRSDCILVLFHVLLTPSRFVAIKCCVTMGVTLSLGFPSFIG